jgi:hypothetical protein
MNLLAIPSSLSRLYSTFPLCLGTTLIEIAVYSFLTVFLFKQWKIEKQSFWNQWRAGDCSSLSGEATSKYGPN